MSLICGLICPRHGLAPVCRLSFVIRWAVIASFAWQILLPATAARAEDAPTAESAPNVLIFLIDDLGWSDIGSNGSTFYDTPHLDQLAASGVQLTHFYSSHPVCSPTRASLMTGRDPQKVGITDWIHPSSGIALPHEEVTLGEMFASGGYDTAWFGKWHLGESDADLPTQHGFQTIVGVNRAGQPASYYFPYARKDGQSSIWNVPDFEDGKSGDYLTDQLTSRIIRFLSERGNDGKVGGRPFLIGCGHYAVHTPIQPPPTLVQKYRDRRMQLYGTTKTPVLPGRFETTSRGRQDDPDYAAMIENLDANIGRVVEALETSGLRRNTIIIFTSDNGGLCNLAKGQPGPTCNLPLRSGKGWNYEGGIRVPCLISWPAELKPARLETPTRTADLYPTLAELCGFSRSHSDSEKPAAEDLKSPQINEAMDGRSLAKLLRGELDETLTDRWQGWYYPHDHGSGHRASAAVRRGRWKLIHYLASQESELFDLEADPGESVNLASEQPEIAAQHLRALNGWIQTGSWPESP